MASSESCKKMHLLHLEDSIADHRLAVLHLQRGGCDAVSRRVDSLSEFQDALANSKIDVVLADYQLAGFTAMDAWTLVVALDDPPPFILLSGAIGETAAVEAIRLGMADYVLKDQMARLAHVVTRAVDMHQAKRHRIAIAQALEHSENRLALLTAHLQESIENERLSIAREIHDDIGGALTAIRLDLAWIDRHTLQPDVADHATAATNMLHHALSASQRIMKNLRPAVLDQGLTAAVAWMARDFETRNGIAVEVLFSVTPQALTNKVETVAFRTTQEALTNVSKHASASHVQIDISNTAGMLTVEVSDDGCGMTPRAQEKNNSFGLAGLRERARTVGGWLDISRRHGRGTSVILSIPLQAADFPEDSA